ncbi:MAG TPA: cytochrome D1 domain-containing protein, partial [Albitalea sp.]|nr:cytochrome D1 domain-containing protein [Albitalea sp.]
MRGCLARVKVAAAAAALLWLGACASVAPPCLASHDGTGDLGLVIGRANGTLTLVNTTTKQALATIAGLGDLSHASIVYSRDGGHAYVFGRDGALTKVNLVGRCIEARVQQAGNSIGGAISQDGSLVAA